MKEKIASAFTLWLEPLSIAATTGFAPVVAMGSTQGTSPGGEGSSRTVGPPAIDVHLRLWLSIWNSCAKSDSSGSEASEEGSRELHFDRLKILEEFECLRI